MWLHGMSIHEAWTKEKERNHAAKTDKANKWLLFCMYKDNLNK